MLAFAESTIRLPEERLPVAVSWTGKSVAAAEHLDDPAILTHSLAMQGNVLSPV